MCFPFTWKQYGSPRRLGCSDQTLTSLSAPRSSSESVASDSLEPRTLGGLEPVKGNKVLFSAHSVLSFLIFGYPSCILAIDSLFPSPPPSLTAEFPCILWSS